MGRTGRRLVQPFLTPTRRTPLSNTTGTTPSPSDIPIANNAPIQSDVSCMLQMLLDQMNNNARTTNERLDELSAAQQVCHNRIDDIRFSQTETPGRTAVAPNPRRVLFDDPVTIRSERTEQTHQTDDQTPEDNRRPGYDDPRRANQEQSDELANIKAQLKLMNSRVHQATSSAPEIDRVLREALNTPFKGNIANSPARHPGKIKITAYDGTTDPSGFLTAFTIAMGRTQFPPHERDAGYCQLFVENLTGSALTWYSKLEAKSIGSYEELTLAFLKHYSMYIEKGACESDLYTLRQGQKESLRSYIGKFKEIVSKINVSDEAAIPALRNGLWYESSFYDEMKKNPQRTLEDALHRATIFIELEEEKVEKAKTFWHPKNANTERQGK